MESSSLLTGQTTVVISGGFPPYDVGGKLELVRHSNIKLPQLPEANYAHCMVITNNNELMTLGGGNRGDKNRCYKLVDGKWQKQNPLTQPRKYAAAIVMSNGIYCFGGYDSPCTSDFLPNGQSEWQAGPAVPEPGIDAGHGVAISRTELLLVGGEGTENKMLKFNIERQEWSEVGSLLDGKYSRVARAI